MTGSRRPRVRLRPGVPVGAGVAVGEDVGPAVGVPVGLGAGTGAQVRSAAARMARSSWTCWVCPSYTA